jgi:chromosome segregation ATPase
MSAPQKFRSAFNGFNREDVASYLEYLNSKHSNQVNQLTAEVDLLRTKLEDAQPDQSEAVSALEAERDELRTQLDALREQFIALQERCAALEQNAPAAITTEDELEVYRRAERTERMARERADIIYRQTNGILKEVSLRVNDMTEQIIPSAEQLLGQLNHLQTAVSATKQSLQDASVILSTLRPDNN